MRLRLAAVAAVSLVAACGPGKQTHTTAKNTPIPRCENVVRPSVLPDSMVQDLGTLAVGAEAAFLVTTGTAGFYVVSQEVGTTAPASVTFVLSGKPTVIPNAVVPTNLVSPGGSVYYDDYANYPTTTFVGSTYAHYYDLTKGLVFDAGQPAVSVLSFPNTSAALQRLDDAGGTIEPGTWRLTVNDWAYECPAYTSCSGGGATGQYHVYVVTRPAPSSKTLDVDVYLATGSTSLLPNAAAATTTASTHVARWKQSLALYLKNGGITLGTVTFHDIDPAVKTKYAANGQVDVDSSDPCSDLSQLFTFSGASTPSQSVHIFFADVLAAPVVGQFKIAGVDGSIPGPSGFPGTITSGAIVGLEDFGLGSCTGSSPSLSSCGTDNTAYVTAHEIGHWLGLLHTTERDGTSFDTLTDTAPCPCAICAQTSQRASCSDVIASGNGSTVVTNGQCVSGSTCGGGDNLMFWLLSGTYSTGSLSPQQGRVMQFNPAVR